jgi:hypothetical protein
MMLPEGERRPGQGAPRNSTTQILALSRATPRDAVARFQDAYAVVVIGKAARRHVFFGLPAAQRAVDRARARGDFADLVLVRLVPVGEACSLDGGA